MSLKDQALLFLLILATIGIFALYYFEQPVLTYERCELCDGNQYLGMYDYFEGKTSEYIASFPYYSRALVPLLASFVPGENPVWGFQIVNLLFSILSVFIIYYLWRKLAIPWYLILTGLFWLVFHWTGMIRLNALDPITIDVPLYLFQALLILICIKRKFYWLLLLAPVAVLQKESIIPLLIVMVLFTIYYNTIHPEDKIPFGAMIAAMVLAILTKLVFTWTYPPVQEGYSSVRLVLFYMKEIMLDPFRIVRWIAGLFTAYGAFLILAILSIRKNIFTNYVSGLLTILSGTCILLSVIGGQDHTRIAFLGFPFVMTWILLLLKDKDWKLQAAALTFSIPLMRIFEKIPDPGKDFSTFALWYPEFAPASVVAGFTGYIALAGLLLIVANLIIKRKG